LEALTGSARERLDLLRRISSGLGDSPARILRSAQALEETGQREAAVDLVARLVERAPGDLAALEELRRLRHAAGDAAGEAEALQALARAARVPEHRVAALLEEARLAHGALGDPARGAACCLAVLESDAGSEEAYRMGRALFEELGDRPGLARLLSRRIAGLAEAPAKHRLLQELAGIRLGIGDADGAKVAAGLALELVPDDVPARRRLAALHTRDGEWNEAIEHLMEAARANRDTEVGQELFFDLGVLYAEHTDRIDLAEKSFVKVLGWNRGHFAAMERLADVYAAMGNWQRAAQALERLTVMADGPEVKARKTVALAEVVDTRLSRPKDAERLLNEARTLVPLAIEPIRGLAGLYTRQRDGMALNVLLDQALAGHSAALETDPDQPALYANLHTILEMKTEDQTASLAVAVLELLGARADFPSIPPDVVEVHWQGGARAGDPTLAEFFCPKAIPPALRETLRAVEEPIARALGASAKQVDLPRDARIDRKHPLALMLSLLGPAFGVRGEITCYRVAAAGLRFAPGAPGIALVPESLARSEDPATVSFAAGAILALAREGLALATILPEDRLRRVVAGMVKLAVPGFAPPGIDPAAVDEEVAALRRAVPEKTAARVAPFAFESGSALERPHLGRNLLAIAHRMGFATAGSLSGALRALAAEHDRPVAPLSLLPGAGSVIAFAFGKDHLELRRRMGV
jgi:tetratricopeptide (TPR) repeat protein